jgi:hypothetical protein
MGAIFLIQLTSIPVAFFGFIWFGAALGSHVSAEVNLSNGAAVMAYTLILLIYLLLFKAPLTAIEMHHNPNKAWLRSKAYSYLVSSLIAVVTYGFIFFYAMYNNSFLMAVIGALGLCGYFVFLRLLWAWLHNNKHQRTP